MKTYEAIIRKGVIVQRDDSAMVRLACDIYVEGYREPVSECFRYTSGGRDYRTAWGLVEIGREVDPTTKAVTICQHPEGLVSFEL